MTTPYSDAELAEFLRSTDDDPSPHHTEPVHPVVGPPEPRRGGGLRTWWKWGSLFVLGPGVAQCWQPTARRDDPVMMRRVPWNPSR